VAPPQVSVWAIATLSKKIRGEFGERKPALPPMALIEH
jgi:hypothetical protein